MVGCALEEKIKTLIFVQVSNSKKKWVERVDREANLPCAFTKTSCTYASPCFHERGKQRGCGNDRIFPAAPPPARASLQTTTHELLLLLLVLLGWFHMYATNMITYLARRVGKDRRRIENEAFNHSFFDLFAVLAGWLHSCWLVSALCYIPFSLRYKRRLVCACAPQSSDGGDDRVGGLLS